MGNGKWRMGKRSVCGRALHDSAPPPGELSPKATEGAGGENREWRIENSGERGRALHDSAPPPGELRRSR